MQFAGHYYISCSHIATPAVSTSTAAAQLVRFYSSSTVHYVRNREVLQHCKQWWPSSLWSEQLMKGWGWGGTPPPPPPGLAELHWLQTCPQSTYDQIVQQIRLPKFQLAQFLFEECILHLFIPWIIPIHMHAYSLHLPPPFTEFWICPWKDQNYNRLWTWPRFILCSPPVHLPSPQSLTLHGRHLARRVCPQALGRCFVPQCLYQRPPTSVCQSIPV